MTQADNKRAIAYFAVILTGAGVIAFMGAAGAFIAENYGRAIYLMLVAIWLKQNYRP